MRVSKPITINHPGTKKRSTATKIRISQRLIKHLNELRKRALKEKDDEKRRDYWWLYHDAKTIEPEICEMILKAENRHLLEMMTEYGLTHILPDDEKDSPPPPPPEEDEEEDKEKPADDDDDHEDDIPPRQMGLWD
jgi:hypothetical protein